MVCMDQSGFIILKNIIQIYGSSIYKDKRRMEGLIRDLYPREYTRERNALIITIKAGIIEQFFVEKSIEYSHSQLFHKLSTEYCLDPELSNWVIRAWRYALSDETFSENQNRIIVERKITVNVREKCDFKEYGSFLTNYIWISDNHIGVILSLFGRHDYYFRKIDRFADPEKFESSRSSECAKDDSQKSDHNHLILNFDIDNNCLENAIIIKSTKNISISNAIVISGGKALHALTVENDHLKEKWATTFKKDYGAITPVIGESSLITVLYSTEWELFNWDYTEPNPSIPTYELVDLSTKDGKLTKQFSIPFENTTTYSNLCIGDVFYLDHWKYNPYLVRNIIAINIKTGKILWKSVYIPQGKINDKPFFIYSSSIIADGDYLYYCLGKKIIALDRITGNTLWEHPLPEMPDEYYLGSERRIVIHDKYVIIAGLDEIKAINKNSGELIWSYCAEFEGDFSNFTSNPIIYKEYIIIGMGDGCIDEDHGLCWVDFDNFIDIIDINTGKEAFKESVDFEVKGNPGILGNKLYYWSEDSLIEISLF